MWLSGSTDGINFSLIGSASTNFAIGANQASEPAEIFAFSTTVSHIRFNITSNHVTDLGWSDGVGLSEVMFTVAGTPGVPEPATWMLMGSGLAALAYVRRKRTT